MNKTLKYLGLLAILPLLTVAITTDYTPEAEALKSKGKDTPGRGGADSYGAATKGIVCGDKLCSEIPGGYAAWKEQQAKSSRIGTATTQPEPAPAPAPKMEDKKMDAMESMEDKKVDPGSVLRLSRANVPAEIPMHKGFYDGGDVYFIITDSSDENHANIITENQGWQVELAPLLANAPDE
ncbi:MAG: hypothetical protein ACE5RJ_01310, partial [Nitrosopumilaceae archaeon]